MRNDEHQHLSQYVTVVVIRLCSGDRSIVVLDQVRDKLVTDDVQH